MGLLSKFLQKINLKQKLEDVAEEFEVIEDLAIVNSQAQSNSTDPNNIKKMVLNNQNYTLINPNPVPSNSAISYSSNTNPVQVSKRQRTISESRANLFCEMIDQKITELIQMRSKMQVIDHKSQQDRIALTISIETLEMTKELVREVFVNQIKD